MSVDVERAIAALALEMKVLAPSTAKTIIERARAGEGTLADLLLSAAREDQVLKAVAAGLGIQYYNLFSQVQDYQHDATVLARADANALRRYSALPMVDRLGQVVVAVANPDIDVVDYLRSRYVDGFSMVLSPKSQIQNRLASLTTDAISAAAFQEDRTFTTNFSALPTVVANRSPVLEWVDTTLAKAVAESASDVHFGFNSDKTLSMRFRIDGVLQRQQVPIPQDRSMEVIGAILAKTETMDPANLREPQDGTFTFVAAGRQIDARVGMLPQIYGPKISIRLLDSASVRNRLDDMGFAPEALSQLRHAMASPAGTIMVSGPTGSGKSTTLYGLVREIDSISKNVLTVEDPVEYKLPNIGQTAIRADLGEKSLTFARALRSILRLDPDVILVGEIRDAETARVAMDAAITGHLVLSTVHAPNAVSVYTRLTEMGAPSYLVAEAITMPSAQRLVRQVHECAKWQSPNVHEARAIADLGGHVPDKVLVQQGCMGCMNGYRGRLAVLELFVPDRNFRSLVARRSSVNDMYDAAKATGTYHTLLQDGMRLVEDGKTTLTELLRVLATEDRD